MAFREVFLEVVQRPLVLLEGGPFEVVSDRFPPVLPEPAVSELLEVLRAAASLHGGVIPAGRQAFAVQRDLLDALEFRRCLDTGHI